MIGKKNDPNPTEFTQEEKLELIQKGLMDPKEAGLTCLPSELPIIGQSQHPHNLPSAPTVMPDAPATPQLGPWLTFEVSPVPPDIRALWAKQDSVIVPFDIEAWKKEHEDEALLQGIMRCGNVQGRFETLVKGGLLHKGFGKMLRDVADRLDQLLEKIQEKNEQTVEEISAKMHQTDEQNSQPKEG